MPVTHGFTCNVADDSAEANAGKVLPSHWNAGHTVSIDLTTEATGLTPGSVPFGGSTGALAQDNANLFWDDTNNRLGVGTTAPGTRIHVKSATAGVYSVVTAEYTDTTTTTGTDSGCSFLLTGPDGLYGNLCGQTDKYNNAAANGIFLPKQVTLQSFAAATGGLTMGAWASDVVLFTTTSGTPAARLTIKSTGTALFAAGSTAAGTAPIKLTSGSLMSSPEVGAIEFLTDKPYFTITTGTARKELALSEGLTSGRVPVATTNGRLTDSSSFLYDAANNRLNIGGASTAGNDIRVEKTVAGQVSQVVINSSTGTGSFSGYYAGNSTPTYAAMLKLSTGYTTAGLLAANDGLVYVDSGKLSIINTGASDIVLATNGTATTNERLRCDSAGNVTIGNAALATNATDGFLYIPTCAGAPSGAPTAKTGRAAMVLDTTNSKLYVRIGAAWKGVTVA